MLCDYGCGQEAKFKVTKSGKMCCSPHRNSCPAMIEKNKISQAKTGFTWSDEKKKQMRESRSGSGNAMYGKRQTLETKNKIRASKKGRTYEQMYGIKETKIKKENYSKKMKGRESWNKGLKLKDHLDPNILSKWSYSFNTLKEKFPMLFLVEDIKYDKKTKTIYTHCKNHKCPNSREKGGWFIPEKYFLLNRARSLEQGLDNNYLYCCDECKIECPLYGKTVKQLLNINDEIHIYTTEEYNTWRNEVLKRANYLCEYCEEKATHVHHSRPQKLEPGFVLDPDFGIACCSNCHYKYGHKTGTECSTGNLANKICK